MSIIADTGIGENLTAIAGGLLGIALIGLIVSNAKNVSNLVATSGQTFGQVLSIATFQNGGVGVGNTTRVGW
jgi:hypothetical protein